MRIYDLLDRYIYGEKGYYYFDIELMWGRNISGGLFHRKDDARRALFNGIVRFLDDPHKYIGPEPKISKKKKLPD
jgi:hypothetical protein